MKSLHWADFAADKIIREKGDKEEYVLASGITPSGTVHFGNFREVITVDLVARALRAKGKKVKFIFSWDDYDTFRKVPSDMPNEDELANYLYQPIVDTPCPYGERDSYAQYHERVFESQLEKMGIEVEYRYQAYKYRNGDYKESIKLALDKASEIRDILNKHRTTPLAEDYLPVSVYCEKCNTDHQISNKRWDGENLTYSCDNCGNEGSIPHSHPNIKLPWRVDWAMRWAYESVDFEPGGKDHSSEGGSFSTGQDIVRLFGGEAPVYLQYDFVSLKGGPGKLSSSSGNVITVDDLLQIYPPEIIRYIYSNAKPNRDFSIDLELGLLRTYEEFDRLERVAYDSSLAPKKFELNSRVYDYSLVSERTDNILKVVSFRELCDTYQTYRCDVQQTLNYYREGLNEAELSRLENRINCVHNWINLYAPEEFKFSLNEETPSLDLSSAQLDFVTLLIDVLNTKWNELDGASLQQEIYDIKNDIGLEPNEVFEPLYQILISKNKGPRLANFILSIPKDQVMNLLKKAL